MHTARDFTGRQVQSRSFLAQLPGIQCVQCVQVRTKVTVMLAAACGQHVGSRMCRMYPGQLC